MRSSAHLKVMKEIRRFLTFKREAQYQASPNMNKVVCWLVKPTPFKIISKIFHKILIFTFDRHMQHKPWKLRSAGHCYYLPYIAVLLSRAYLVHSKNLFQKSQQELQCLFSCNTTRSFWFRQNATNIMILSLYFKRAKTHIQFPYNMRENEVCHCITWV